MAVVKLQRVFRLGATDFPDPDPDLEPTEVLSHFSSMYPQLRYGKVSEGASEGDSLVFEMKPNVYLPNG